MIGDLDPLLAEAFGGLALTPPTAPGSPPVLLADQAQLRWVLRQLFVLGPEVVSFAATPAAETTGCSPGKR